MIKKYIQIFKPGIIIANLLSVICGFFFFITNYIYWNKLFFTLLAVGLIISSGCIFNNIIDIDIDKKMHRTKNRLLVKSFLNILYIKILAILFFLFSIFIFLYKINFLSCVLSLFGFFVYVMLYTLYMKRTSIYSTIFGAISGAIPIVIGYCTLSNNIDTKVIILFLIFYIWQIPHSYAILIIYQQDYFLAKIPTIVHKKGLNRTIREIIFYIIIFFILIIFAYIKNYIPMINLIILSILNTVWLCISFLYLKFMNNLFYAKLLFYCSIIIIFMFNILSIISNIYLFYHRNLLYDMFL